MNRIYCVIGKMVEVTQNIEVCVLDVIENSEIIKEFARHKTMTNEDYVQAEEDAKYLKNKMETMTFGQIISIVYESESLKYDEITELKALLEKRNYFTHEYFKVTNFGTQPSESFIVEEFTALKEYLKKLTNMLSRLELIKKGQGERLSYLKKKTNISFS